MNEKELTFEQFLASQSIQIPLWSFVFNLLLTAGFAYVLARFYVRFGQSLSNRKQFAGNFMLIATTTMLIISIVKSSLALSLGLVGALSIVRFRSAIKEPEELAYLFLLIAIGLGFGADQRVTTIVAFAFILAVLWLTRFMRKKEEAGNMYLTIGAADTHNLTLSSVVDVLKQHCRALELKRLDENGSQLEAAFVIQFDSFSDLESARTSLHQLNDSLSIAFIDSQGLGG